MERKLLHSLTPFYGQIDWAHHVLWAHRRRHWNHAWSPWTASWFGESACIHRHEGGWQDATGNGYFGGFQFLPSTWASVGGYRWGSPQLQLPHVQRLMAWRVWLRDGGSWREWGTAGICGLS